MRINKYVAQASGLSRRAADAAIAQGRVKLNGKAIIVGTDVKPNDVVTLDDKQLVSPVAHTTIMLNKPAGYVVSREGQGSQTIYDLLPTEFHNLKPVGRLDKDSSGLLLLTDGGELANQLTHPRYAKTKIYEVALDKPLAQHDEDKVEQGVMLEDGMSKLRLTKLGSDKQWLITMQEGRNRQIRRTFAALGYNVTRLHRTHFGNFQLHGLDPGRYQVL